MSLLDTIAALHAELDANPSAHDTRGILADALEDAGDPRAEGYRALGANCLHPDRLGHEKGGTNAAYFSKPLGRRGVTAEDYCGTLPDDWYDAIEHRAKGDGYFPLWAYDARLSRREAEDAAALAFSKLPAQRRTELLAPKSAEEVTPPCTRV